MARVLVTGGSGDLGRHVVRDLVERGHAVRVLVHNRMPPRVEGDHPLEFNPGDLTTGEGLENALLRAETVVHCATNPFKTSEVDIQGTERLLRAAESADVHHFLYISIVGIDDFPGYSYYRVKREVEQLITASRLPWTILRATQFHELAVRFLQPFDRLPFAFVPRGTRWQLIAASDAARRLGELVDAGPSGRTRDVGGPEALTSEEVASSYRLAKRLRPSVMSVPVPGSAAKAFRAGKHLAPDARYGQQTWYQFLTERYGSTRAR
jgi:uncharacterized protein YbjT (DUF2867 family)